MGMEPDTDLRPVLDPLFAGEPPTRPVSDHLRAGRRQRTRRRTTTGLGALAVVGVLGAGYGLVTAGASTSTPPTTPLSSRTPTPTPTVTTQFDQPEGPEDQARIRGFSVDHADGTVTPAPGVTVLDTIVHEVGEEAGAVAVAVRNDGQEHWYRLTWAMGEQQGGESESHTRPADEPGLTFAAWDAAAQERSEQPDPDPDFHPEMPVTFDRYGVWTLADGVELLDEIENPYGLAAPYTSAALTLRDADGVTDWVLTPSSARSVPHTGPDSLRELVERDADAVSSSVKGPMPHLLDAGPNSMPTVVDGVEVLRTVDNPLDLSAPRDSVAYELRGEGHTWWVLWERGPSGKQVALTTRVAGDGYDDLTAWLADQKARAEW